MDSSFSSTGSNSSALHQDARRVDRFLSINNNRKTPSPTLRVPSPILGLASLSACGSSDSLQYVAFEKPPKTYVIEGIHGPVTTEKAPIGAISKKQDHKRSRQRFKQYVAAKQSERARKFSLNVKGVDVPHMAVPGTTEYEALYPRQNESPTTITADISKLGDASRYQTMDDSFIYTKSPLKSNFNKNIGMIPKKKLTWWDSEENKHKPFLLRSDDLWDDESIERSRERAVLFGNSGCPHDNLKDLIEDFSNRFKSTVVDLFQVKRIGDNPMFRDNFASFSEDLNEDYEDQGGCAGPTQLIKVVKNIMPPVCEFETYDVSRY